MTLETLVVSRHVDELVYLSAILEKMSSRCFFPGKGLGLFKRPMVTAAVEFQLTCADKTLTYPLMNRSACSPLKLAR